jgi:hypothetical protein
MGGKAVSELARLSRDDVQLADALREFLETGAPFVVCEIDDVATERTGDFVVRYQVSDGLKVLLAAARARHGIPDNKVETVAEDLFFGHRNLP